VTSDHLDREGILQPNGPLEPTSGEVVDLRPNAARARRPGPPTAELTVSSFGEVAARVAAAGEPRWLIQGLWPADAYGVLAAQEKAGKTWAALDLAVSVATGRPLAGLADDFALRPGDVPQLPDRSDEGRALPPFVLEQLVAALPVLEQRSRRVVRVAVQLLIDTGRRPDEVCSLGWGLSGAGPRRQARAHLPRLQEPPPRPAAGHHRPDGQADRRPAADRPGPVPGHAGR
jgi:AAA domain-containing protein